LKRGRGKGREEKNSPEEQERRGRKNNLRKK